MISSIKIYKDNKNVDNGNQEDLFPSSLFAHILNDAELSAEPLHKTINMANLYIKRFVYAALCIFGFEDFKIYRQIYRLYIDAELSDGYDYISSQLAISQAVNVLQTYDTRFNQNVITDIITKAHLEVIVSNDYNKFINEILLCETSQ